MGPFGEKVAGPPQRGGANLGGREEGSRLSLPKPGNPSPQPESCLEEERDVNKTPSTALPTEPGLARLLSPAPMGAGCSWDGHVPTGTMSLVGSGQGLGQDMGRGIPKGSLGELPGIRGSCKKLLTTARKVL